MGKSALMVACADGTGRCRLSAPRQNARRATRVLVAVMLLPSPPEALHYMGTSLADAVSTPSGMHMHPLFRQLLPGLAWFSWRDILVRLIERVRHGAYGRDVSNGGFLQRKWMT